MVLSTRDALSEYRRLPDHGVNNEVIDHGNVCKMSGPQAIPYSRKPDLTSQTQFVKLPTYITEGPSPGLSFCVVFKTGSLNVGG